MRAVVLFALALLAFAYSRAQASESFMRAPTDVCGYVASYAALGSLVEQKIMSGSTLCMATETTAYRPDKKYGVFVWCTDWSRHYAVINVTPISWRECQIDKVVWK